MQKLPLSIQTFSEMIGKQDLTYTRYRDTDEGVMWESSRALAEATLRKIENPGT